MSNSFPSSREEIVYFMEKLYTRLGWLAAGRKRYATADFPFVTRPTIMTFASAPLLAITSDPCGAASG
jgi:hypothetical protein